MILNAAHRFLMLLYVLLPVLALVVAYKRATQNRSGVPLFHYLTTLLAGMLLGGGLCVLYGNIAGVDVGAKQVLLLGYFTTAYILIFRVFDFFLRNFAEWALGLKHGPRGKVRYQAKLQAASLFRFVILFGVGIPYTLVVAATYRPKSQPGPDPQFQFGFDFEQVDFHATDGTHLSGWWIPSSGRSRMRTVIICPGIGATKSTELMLARDLVPHGYNVFIFDFRGHGQSSGQVGSFGDLERCDVLGAVRWVKTNHAVDARKLYGVGVNTGGAALIAAAADPSEDGRSIDALAVYGTYARFGDLADEVSKDYLVPPLNWLARFFGPPMVALQTGARVGSFEPAALVDQIWPRPIFVIHGMRDFFVPYNEGLRLYNAASAPKTNYWLERADERDVIENDEVLREVRRFFDSARAYPVI